MSDKNWVRKLMLPISEYGTVDLDATLEEALRALESAQASAGRRPHRSVLVKGRDGTIAGWLGYHAILAALRPRQQSVVLDDSMRRAGVSEDLMLHSMEMLELLQPDLSSLCARACSIAVKDLVLTEPQVVSIEAPLNVLLDRFVTHQAQSLLVVEGKDVVGILRIGDFFDEVTHQALSDGDSTCAEKS